MLFHCIYCLKKNNQVIGYLLSETVAPNLYDAGDNFADNGLRLCKKFDCDMSINVIDANATKKLKPKISSNQKYVFEEHTNIGLEYTSPSMRQALTRLIISLFK